MCSGLRVTPLLVVSACYQPSFEASCRVSCEGGGCPDQLVCGSDRLCHDGTVECSERDGGVPPNQSCAHLAATCGAHANDGCCLSPHVPAGTFMRSYDVAADGMYPDASHPATVSAFRLDRYKVTVGRFRQFVLAGKGTRASPPTAGDGAHAGLASSGWDPAWNVNLAADTATLAANLRCDAVCQTWTDTPGTNENRPINCISWYEAAAFCAWDLGFLPTEAEWAFAAAGGSAQRAYPWSSPPSSTTVDCSEADYGGANFPTTACNPAGPSDVGTAPAGDGMFGQSDLGGNVWDWLLDWYASPYVDPCADCANLATGTRRAIRGGSYDVTVGSLRVGNRDSNEPMSRFPVIGARCARPP